MQVVIADDQAAVRSALGLRLEQEPDYIVAAEAADTAGLWVTLSDLQVDLLLLDWELPGPPMEGLLQPLRLGRPGLQIVAMSSNPEAQEISLSAGADAFLSKCDPPDVWISTLRRLSWPQR